MNSLMKLSMPLRLVLMAILCTTALTVPGSAQDRDSDRRRRSDRDRSAESDDEGQKSGGEHNAEKDDGEAKNQEADQEADEQPLTPPAIATENTVAEFGDSPDTVTFTFRDAPWPEVLEQFADWAGLSLDLTDTPPGYFNYYDDRSHTPSEAIDVLNGYLLPRGYTVLRRNRFLAVLKTDNELLDRLIPTIERSELSKRGDNELVRMVVPVEKITPETAAEEVESLLSPYGSATPVASSNSLVLVGFGSTLRRVLELLDDAVPPLTDDKLDFKSIALEHLPASEAEKQIRTLFGLDSPNQPQNVSGARSEVDRMNYYRRRSRRRGRDDDDDDRNRPPMPLMQKVAMNMQVSSIDRTNSLLVTATPEGLELIEQILTSIDVPQGDGAAQVASSNEPYLKVYRLGAADEEEVAKTIDALLPGLVINEDRRQDTIHIHATSTEHQEVQELIQRLDGGGIDGRSVEVVKLRQTNPYAMEEILSGMFDNEDRDNRPIIQADPETSTLVIRGSEAQVAQVRSALAAYGEGTEAGASSNQSRFRRIETGGRSARTIAEAAEAILAGDDGFHNSIRVVVPGRRGQESDDQPAQRTTRRPESGGWQRSQVESKTIGPDDFTTIAPDDHGARKSADELYQPVSLTADVKSQQETAQPNETQDESGASAADSSSESSTSGSEQPERPRVQIEARGDELYLYGGDPEVLGEVEATIRELMQQMPDRKNWTVFYLRVAEASEVATRLYDLVDDPSALYSPYPEPVDSDTPPLQIVPDERTNSLFVSGPQEKIDQIENLLEYLDAVDVPESFRERRPHTILVQHADVTDVAEMIRNLYKDHLTDPAAESRRRDDDDRNRRRGRDEDERRRRGGGGGGGESPGVRMTLAVDERTNELIVSCDEPLFQEVEALVKQRDQAVAQSQPTVQMVPIGTASTPAEMAEILQGMSTKIETEVIVSEQDDDDDRNRDRRRRRRRD